MDMAYDHIQEEALPEHGVDNEVEDPTNAKETLNAEFQEAYKAISSSPWGMRFGAFVGNVKRQGESYYETAKKESTTVTETASKGLIDLRTTITNRTRSLSLRGNSNSISDPEKAAPEASARSDKAEESLLSKLRKGAALRIKEIEAAEARADEYLAKFGSNIGTFLRDAVTIEPAEDEGNGKEVLFESIGGDESKRQIYTTRLDAQLHMLHTTRGLFKQDPEVESYGPWGDTFSIDDRTDNIANDLDKYPELRTIMEALVPDQVQYAPFWRRYYFLRNELDIDEQKRKDLLKGASLDEEEVGWDEEDDSSGNETSAEGSVNGSEDEDEEDEEEGNEGEDVEESEKAQDIHSDDPELRVKSSTDTLPAKQAAKPLSSTDRSSQPDSEASSYDVVSGAPSQLAGSPPKPKANDEDSDDDWE